MFRGYIGVRLFLLSSLLCLTAASAGAQNCINPGAYCEGWSRDSTRREVSLTRTTECSINLQPCPAVCTSGPITALPSIRIGSLNHVVLGFTITNACVPECPGAIQEDCFNVGVSYRRKVNTGSEAVTNEFFCDPSDPTTKVFGIGLGVAVLLDVTLIRMVLVPAVMSVLDARAWWLPARLDRVLPRIDLDTGANEDALPGDQELVSAGYVSRTGSEQR